MHLKGFLEEGTYRWDPKGEKESIMWSGEKHSAAGPVWAHQNRVWKDSMVRDQAGQQHLQPHLGVTERILTPMKRFFQSENKTQQDWIKAAVKVIALPRETQGTDRNCLTGPGSSRGHLVE
jgi:hypothetical protein